MLVCSVRSSQQTPIIPLYNFHELIFIMESYCVLCEVRTESAHTFISRLILVFGSAITYKAVLPFSVQIYQNLILPVPHLETMI
jgi:hypothetical protein